MKKRILALLLCAITILLFILDTTTASSGAAEGIELCLKVLLPTLFPFFIITTYMNALLVGVRLPGMHYLGRWLHVPLGGDSILLLGMLGGYPVGAQLIGDLYLQEKIDKRTGHILLGYCSNAGPAFIFGVTGILFSNPRIPFLLWIIHLLSAVLTGLLLPKPTPKEITMQSGSSVSFVQSLQKSIRICASVCAWVITFKIIQAYLGKWFISNTHAQIGLILSGILELSNGCIGLMGIHSEPIRFILCSGFLAFGGVCVMMQTTSVTECLGLGLYLPGKLIQTAISLILSSLFSIGSIGITTVLYIIMPCSLVMIIIKVLMKKDVEILRRIMYNAITEA